MRAFDRDARHSTDPRPTPIELTQEDRHCIEGGGNVYTGRFEGEVQEMEGWLCPALNLYYPDAPKKLYVQVRAAK